MKVIHPTAWERGTVNEPSEAEWREAIDDDEHANLLGDRFSLLVVDDDSAAVEQAITDQTALQSEARHAVRFLEDERPQDELTGDQAADALGRALQAIRDAHTDTWPF